QRRRRLDALKDLVERRAAERGRSIGGRDHAWPFVLLVLDDVTTLRTDPTVAYLLREGPSVGVLALCIARDHAGLPAEATVTVELVAPEMGPAGLTLRTPDGEVTNVLPDGVSEEHAADVARALAPRFE